MAEENWEVVDEVAGEIQGEIIRGFLEAQGVSVWLSQEGAGRIFRVDIGELGKVQILVPSDEVEHAREVLDAYYAGDFENESFASDGEPLPPDGEGNEGLSED
ncbi:MAG: hypothetical protein EHM70_05120 [Chloroflexota bacterium]|nr:MAG: hypothetical protein EHM70_05120 [Chloroflexota bacterium]